MSISVEYDCLESKEEALALLEQAGLHTMALEVPAVNNATHWHHFSSVFFILSGTLQLTDAASGQCYDCHAGCRVTVPARALHFEQSDSGYEIALGTSVPPDAFGDPVNLPPEALNQQ